MNTLSIRCSKLTRGTVAFGKFVESEAAVPEATLQEEAVQAPE